ncbi:hypothetical protein GCM10017687_02890 [Streptomyces echinatus]|uniref:AraC-like DNA-binding protein n=1 Tax=Streptomyces echinatus TaxID=67293 RepID=A0A7W9Q2Y4_9ACTN|nr:AraC-like DNA-binding protein [Streptomyces echinatus]
MLAVSLPARLSKEAYGETPGRCLTHRRIERAEEMLRSANLTVTEICTLVGFSSLGTFSARFKTRTGLTPSEYRTRHVGRGAALIPGCYAMLWAGGFDTARSKKRAAPGPAYGDRRPSSPRNWASRCAAISPWATCAGSPSAPGSSPAWSWR